MAFCRYCGHELDSDAVFCAACGKKQINDSCKQNDETTSHVRPDTERQNNAKKDEPALVLPGGWFRYNYDKERLEFIDRKSRIVSQIWNIPKDQWDALPSHSEYCKSILQAEKEERKKNKKYIKNFVIVVILLFILLLIFSRLFVSFIRFLGDAGLF